jgi:hypothetical protein
VRMGDSRPHSALYLPEPWLPSFRLIASSFCERWLVPGFEPGDERRGSCSRRRCRPSVDQQRPAVGRPSSKSAKIAKRPRAGPMSVNPSAVEAQMRACALDRHQSCVGVARPAKRIHGHLPQHRGKLILIHHTASKRPRQKYPVRRLAHPCAFTYHLACHLALTTHHIWHKVELILHKVVARDHDGVNWSLDAAGRQDTPRLRPRRIRREPLGRARKQ